MSGRLGARGGSSAPARGGAIGRGYERFSWGLGLIGGGSSEFPEGAGPAEGLLSGLRGYYRD